MRRFCSPRWFLLALLVLLIPSSSFAGVFISVGFAPPPLVVYDQPPCPQPGWMWTPGYWAYGPDGYYWVPGAWVPAPYEGALWTPGYWGWNAGLYVWHPGYWGPHVGYYGGIDYGFGYMGIGFVGGMWRGPLFVYNTAVMHVGTGGAWANRVYVDRTVVERNTVVDPRHVAYNGGPGGIDHRPTPQERSYMNEKHMAPTPIQTAHIQAAAQNRNAYFNANHGHPQQAAVARPMAAPGRTNTMGNGSRTEMNRGGNNARYEGGREQTARPNPQQQARPMEQQRPQEQARPQQARPQEQMRPQEQARPQTRPEARPQERPQARPEEHSQPRGDSRDKGHR